MLDKRITPYNLILEVFSLYLVLYYRYTGSISMNTADLLKVQLLSKQVAAFGLRSKPVPQKKKYSRVDSLNKRTGLDIPKKRIENNSRPTPFKFDYKSIRKDTPVTPPSENELLGIISPLVEQALQEKYRDIPVSPEFVREIVKQMHLLPENDKLEISKGIRNAESFIFAGTRYKTAEMMHGAGSSTGNSTNIYNEIIAGSGTLWILALPPDPGTLRLYANGQRLIEGVDFTISVMTITTFTSWAAGTVLADYQTT